MDATPKDQEREEETPRAEGEIAARLAPRYIVRLYEAAIAPRSPLRPLLHDREPLAFALDVDSASLGKLTAARVRDAIASRRAELDAEDARASALVEGSVAAFATRFRLDAIETAVLRFAAIARHCDELDNLLANLPARLQREVARALEPALGICVGPLRVRLSPSSQLLACGLLDPDIDSSCFCTRLGLLEGSAAVLLGVAGRGDPLCAEFLGELPAARVAIDDYPHLTREIELASRLLRGAVASRAAGVHVLLHGEPGTGKTELSRLLASLSGARGVPVPDANRAGVALEARMRMRHYTSLLRLLGRGGDGLIVFDEVEENLESPDRASAAAKGRTGPASQKAWKNRLLESAPVPTIWIANALDAVDPALLRRFTLVIEVPRPPRRARLAMLARAAGDLAGAERVQRALADEERLTPADIERARRAARLVGGDDGATAFLDALSLRAGARPRVRSGSSPTAPRLPERDAWLRSDPPVNDLASLLARRRSGRLLFAGPPGTGKTALARRLARALDVPLHEKKTSDIVSPWVGQTETNLAEAFEDARRDGALLLFDEADSWLASRESAQRSWEITQVNQLLKEMEDCDGLLVFCTNHFATLDAAVLRRLDLKVRFDRLDGVAAREVFAAACDALGIEDAGDGRFGDGEFGFGDFAAALRQAWIRDVGDAGGLRECLEGERRAREEQRGRPIGFALAPMNA